jgi:hypothetical protein
MKTIQNKTTTILKSEDVMATYADLFVILLNKPLQKMVTISDMRRDLKLLDLLEAAGETIEVSDEDFKHLVELVKTSEWALKHLDILEFVDYIESLV